ncbi:hypothetical protein LVD15_14715 [Fulvivirga maritima]|uniref:hypothetical protein n=1 Tax=Fulvivirga maritima TaxID=2904247 RepID=UPI001F340C28|nr:hypothetical protein [Fulvivirga maritima]UII24575.1 hypothetical protein LVD15_14715 [Fulvivirga maritima]
METFVDIALWVAMAMVAIAGIAAIVLPLINSFSNPKSLLKSAIGVVGIAVLFLITWSVAGNEVTNRYIEFGVNESSSKLVGGVLLLMYVLFGIACVGIVITEINKALK